MTEIIRYTKVRNDFITARGLSAVERLILIYLGSKLDGWKVNEHDICQSLHIGRDSVQRALRNLRASEWITKPQSRQDERGHWAREAGQLTDKSRIVLTDVSPGRTEPLETEPLETERSVTEPSVYRPIDKGLSTKDSHVALASDGASSADSAPTFAPSRFGTMPEVAPGVASIPEAFSTSAGRSTSESRSAHICNRCAKAVASYEDHKCDPKRLREVEHYFPDEDEWPAA